MDLSFDHPGNYLYVRQVATDAITVGAKVLRRSFLLAPDRVIEAWPVADVGALDAADAGTLLALQPELVLLGSGSRQTFPAAAFMAALLQQGIGVEVMDNAAAARTFGLLAGEGRRVVAAFILPAAEESATP